jgi:hypothetical protein
VALAVALAGPAAACPTCRDAVAQTSAADEADQLREAQAYNRSIYLMLAVPYLAVGVVGFLVYRGLRRREVPGA